MFLKIIREENGNQVESIYECTDIQITKRKDEMIFSLDRTLSGDNIAIVINGDKTRYIYLMNEHGKTIEYISWKAKTKPSCYKGGS